MNLNHIELIDYDFPLFNNEFPVDPPFLTPSLADLTASSNRLEGLQLDYSTQSLRIKVERAKRQKLGVNLKRIKKATSAYSTGEYFFLFTIRNFTMLH